jgi:hypothetical protein
MTAPNLKPCVFCGGDVKLVEREESAFIQCLKVSGHRAIFLQGDNAISDEVVEMWNTRPALIQAMIDKAVGEERERCAAISDAAHVSHVRSKGRNPAEYYSPHFQVSLAIRKGAKP